MGDRANIAIAQPDGGYIYLYTHWAGYRINESLAAGLDAGRSRWDDRPYLTRILFDALTQGETGTTGFGIDSQIGDNSYPIPIVVTSSQAVHLEDRWYGFEEFIKKFSGS